MIVLKISSVGVVVVGENSAFNLIGPKCKVGQWTIYAVLANTGTLNNAIKLM
jgi:hypothetical protein